MSNDNEVGEGIFWRHLNLRPFSHQPNALISRAGTATVDTPMQLCYLFKYHYIQGVHYLLLYNLVNLFKFYL